MRNHKDILDIAMEAWLNEPVPAGPSPELAEATLARIAALSGRGRGYALWDAIWERIYRNRRMLELAAAAAIIIIAGLLFFIKTPDKAAVYAEAIDALKKVDNIITENYSPDKSILFQKIWTSRTAKKMMFRTMYKTGDQYVLYDLDNNVKKTKKGSGPVQIEQLTEEMYANVNKSILNRVDLIPFPNLSLTPKGLTWRTTEPETDEAGISGTKIYDIEWTKDIPNYGLHKRRIFIDINSMLPVKVEKYHKMAGEEFFEFEDFTIITYPEAKEIESQIRSVFE